VSGPEKAPAAEGQKKPSVPEALSPIERLLAGQIPQPSVRLRQFGYDLFRRAPTTFAPITDVPVGPDYVIGPGDSLNIVLWGGVQATYQVGVDRNGAIALPRLGVVQVWGLTLQQLQALLRQRFAEFYPDFQMAVTLGRLRTIRVYVVGEVRQPGAYTVSSLSTIINALFASGGPTKNGSLRRIRLVRHGKTIHTLDLYDFLLQGDKSQDQTLQSGDTIFVPVIGPIAGVAGNVKRPAIYEVEPGTTLRQLFDLAGGVTPLGYLQRVQVERIVANEKKVVADLDLSMLEQHPETAKLWQTRIADGDLVRVFSIVTALENIVELQGHVVRPGRYELKPGMRVRDLLPSYDALLPEPYLDYAEIVRYVEPDLRRIVVPFNLGALLAGDASQNLLLYPRDTVRIYARSAFVDRPTATIRGEVRKPGTYPLLGEMRVQDLVAKAGWITKEAYLKRAELLRITETHDLRSMPFNLEAALRRQSPDNLLLQDKDVVVIHNLFEQKFRQRVRISGMVHQPGVYLLTKGMRISDLVFRAGGVQKLAYLEKAELTRHTIDQGGDVAIRVEVDLRKAIAGDPEHNLLLRDFDHLLVRQIPGVVLPPKIRRKKEARLVATLRRTDIQEDTVEIRGEVRFPGVYPILKGERLSSVLRRAGGFTDKAYLPGAVFTRQSVRAAQEKRLQELLREQEQRLLTESAAEAETALSPEEVQGRRQALVSRRALLDQLRTVKPEGRVVVRLQPLAVFAGSDQDIELEAGDRLVVPRAPKYVNIIGQVYNRTALIYEPNKDVAYYLDKVGGLKSEANAKEIFIVRVDGTVISRSQGRFTTAPAGEETPYLGDFFAVRLQPGDTIVVPGRLKTPATLRAARDIVQIIFQSASTLGLILALL
jgi:protein involved in polysaccharide export with SLBB domain